MKSGVLIGTAVVLLFAAVAATMLSKPVQIAYHRRALDRLHDEIAANPSVVSDSLLGYGDGEQFERQYKHLKRLVDLGYFFHKRYELENLPDTGEVHSAVWHLLQKEFPSQQYPELSYPELSYPELSYPDNVLEVWDLAEQEPKWDAFVAKHNVSDFAERFMTQTENAKRMDESVPE